MKEIVFLIAILWLSNVLLAQDTSGARQEGWPEVNLYYKFNNKMRLFAMYSATRLRTSEFTDGGTGLYLDYFARGALRIKKSMWDSTRGYYLWIRSGYYYSSTPPDSKDPVKEHTIAVDANSRYHLPYDVLMTHKNRIDIRFRNGDFQPRYRTRLTLEKEVQTLYLFIIPYIYGEYFLNLYSGSANRFRLCIGYELKVTNHITVESYFLHQFKNGDIIEAVNAVGFALKFYLPHQEVKKFISKRKKRS